MKKALALVLALVMVLTMTMVFSFAADEGYALPTEFGGKTIDWDVDSKSNKPAVMEYYGGLDVAYWQGLINVYNGNDRYASTVSVWLGDDGYVTTNYPGTYDTTNNGQAVALKGINYIATLTDKQVEAAAEEIGYFCFLVVKEDYFFREANSDKVHEGLDVLPAIMDAAIEAIKAKAGAVSGGTAYALPTTYNGKTIDWTVDSKSNKPAVMEYYGGVDVANWQGLIYCYNSIDFVDGAEGTYGETSRYNLTVSMWLADDGYVTTNYPSTYDTSTCGQHEAKLLIEKIAGLTKQQTKNAAKEVGYAVFCAAEEYRLFLETNSDKQHEGLDVLPFILQDAGKAIDAAKDTAPADPTPDDPSPETSDMINVVAIFAGIAVLTAAVVVLKKKYN